MLLFIIAILGRSKTERFIPISSNLFLRNSSFLFNSQVALKMPGNIITIPTLSTFRVFSIKNLYVYNNLEHFITNSKLLQDFKLNINSCRFSNFLESPISMILYDKVNSSRSEYNESNSRLVFSDILFVNCSGYKEYGGAISIIHCEYASFNNCIFNNCSSLKSGGAVFIEKSVKVAFENVTFSSCYIGIVPGAVSIEFGGAVCLSNVQYITLDKLDFEDCYSSICGGGSLFVHQAESLSIRSTIFNKGHFQNSFETNTYGGGALLLNVSEIYFNNIQCIECSATFGSGIAVNLYDERTIPPSSFSISTIKGAYLNGTDCTNSVGCIAFHFSDFKNLNTIYLTDNQPRPDTRFLFSISSSIGRIHYIRFIFTDPETTGSFYIWNFEPDFNDGQANHYLTLDCAIIDCAKDDTNILYYLRESDEEVTSYGIFIELLNYLVLSQNETVFQFPYDPQFFNSTLAKNIECFIPTPTPTLSSSEEFSVTIEFSNSNNFTKSDIFSESADFSESTYFTNSIAFTDSMVFTYTLEFEETWEFTSSKKFTSSSEFTPSSKFTPTQPFTPSSEYRSRIPHPTITNYNMGIGTRNGKGTKTDLGLVTIYVCIALLAVLLIVVIVFAICKTRQPTVERNAHVNQPDEFYFPDFDNFDEDN